MVPVGYEKCAELPRGQELAEPIFRSAPERKKAAWEWRISRARLQSSPKALRLARKQNALTS